MAEWEIDFSGVNGLRNWYKKQPKLIQKASAMLLNNFAFGTRDEAIKQIGAMMVVRSPTFVASRLRVTKANLGAPIANQRALMGSMAADRFSGWKEQELGTPTERKRISTMASRKGNIRNRMIAKSRLKPGAEVVTINDRTPRGGTGNLGGFVAMLMRQGYKGLIRIGGKFYVLPQTKTQGFVGPGSKGVPWVKQLIMMQEVKREQPKQKHWLRTARAVYFKRNDPQTTWARVVDRLMTAPGKR